MSVTAEGDAQIIASSITGSSRITKGRSISLNLTILDTSLRFENQAEAQEAIGSTAYVSFKQGGFKRGTASGDSLTNITVGAGKNLQYSISMTDLVYTGSGDTVEFVVGYSYGGKDYKYNMSMKIPNCIPYVDKDDPEEDDEDVNLDPLIPLSLSASMTTVPHRFRPDRSSTSISPSRTPAPSMIWTTS